LSVATSRTYKNSNDEKVDETTWFRVAVWGKQAENCAEYLSKGRGVLITGRMIPDPQTGGPRMFTRQDGTVGTSFEMTAQNVRFLPSGNGNGSAPQAQDGSPDPVETEDEDEIPF
jgi:single-strand DNA-binding protein